MDAAELRRERLDDAGGQALVVALLEQEDTKTYRNTTIFKMYNFLEDPDLRAHKMNSRISDIK